MKAKTTTTIEPVYYVIQFKGKRTDYYIDRNRTPLEVNDWVLVQAERGKDLGYIIGTTDKHIFEMHSQHKYPLEILRKADDKEIDYLNVLREKEKEVVETTLYYVSFRGLTMKLVDAEYQYDSNKLTIYFTADDRVDFRELVKDLAATYKTRIELRQIGVRDEVKRLGGIGPCGLVTCCSKFLRTFDPISTQMARQQNLAVNPSKISGLCERLMCCLNYEACVYDHFASIYPQQDETHKTIDGKTLHVESVDYFKDKITVKIVEDEEFETITLIDFKKRLTSRKDFLKKWMANGHKINGETDKA